MSGLVSRLKRSVGARREGRSIRLAMEKVAGDAGVAVFFHRESSSAELDVYLHPRDPNTPSLRNIPYIIVLIKASII